MKPVRCNHCRGTGSQSRFFAGDRNNTKAKTVRIACVRCSGKGYFWRKLSTFVVDATLTN